MIFKIKKGLNRFDNKSTPHFFYWHLKTTIILQQIIVKQKSFIWQLCPSLFELVEN